MPKRVGRGRDESIDARVLAVARKQLSEFGYKAMSIASIAETAGTTRQAIYRRWPGKAELAAAVLGGIDDGAARRAQPASDAFSDLVAELTDFQRGVSHKGRMSLVGTMLQDTTDPSVREQYRRQVVAPRRARLRAILQRGISEGVLDSDGDVEVALTMCTGSWYGRALAGSRVPRDWPRRTAALVWRALGGQPPVDGS